MDSQNFSAPSAAVITPAPTSRTGEAIAAFASHDLATAAAIAATLAPEEYRELTAAIPACQPRAALPVRTPGASRIPSPLTTGTSAAPKRS